MQEEKNKQEENVQDEAKPEAASAGKEAGTVADEEFEERLHDLINEALAGNCETAGAAGEADQADGTDESEESDGTGEEADQVKDKKKGLFQKKKDKKDEQIEDLTDRLKRQMAEFDNFRKRTEKEKSAMYEIGAKSVVEKILPVVDNFERGLGAVEEAQKEDPFVDGMDKVYKQLMAVLEEIEVKPIEAVGQQFDPELHNAVMHVEDEEQGENVVVEEFQKGYTYRESVVRHSMVKVAN